MFWLYSNFITTAGNGIYVLQHTRRGHIDFGADPIGIGQHDTSFSAQNLVNQWLDCYIIFIDI